MYFVPTPLFPVFWVGGRQFQPPWNTACPNIDIKSCDTPFVMKLLGHLVRYKRTDPLYGVWQNCWHLSVVLPISCIVSNFVDLWIMMDHTFYLWLMYLESIQTAHVVNKYWFVTEKLNLVFLVVSGLRSWQGVQICYRNTKHRKDWNCCSNAGPCWRSIGSHNALPHIKRCYWEM